MKELTWYGGVDLSNRLDLTSVSLVAFDKEKKLYILNKSFIPEGQINNKEKYDRMKVLSWKEAGYLDVCAGNSVDYDYVHQFFNQYRDLGINILFIGFDIAQGALTFSSPMREFEILMLYKKIHHNNNYILSWAVGNVVVVQNANANIRPDKIKASDKIDPFVATLNALYLALKFKNKEDEKLDWLEADAPDPFL